MKYAKRMLVLMLVAVPVIAVAQQLRSTDKLVAKVPFRFMVANRYVPAGDCILQKADMAGRVLIIRDVEAEVGLLATASVGESKEASSKYELVFNKYGDRYFLSEVRIADSRTTYSLPQSREEGELRAQNAVASEYILVASLQQ